MSEKIYYFFSEFVFSLSRLKFANAELIGEGIEIVFYDFNGSLPKLFFL